MHIYYFNTMQASFRSGMTIQVVRDYKHLAELGHTVHLYGATGSESSPEEILRYVDGTGVRMHCARGDLSRRKGELGLRCLCRMIAGPEGFVVMRQFAKLRQTVRLAPLLGRHRKIFELHEQPFPHMTAGGRHSRESCLKALRRLDGILLTNYSQVEVLKREFPELDIPVLIAPNGVEYAKFAAAKRAEEGASTRVLTYAGQFTPWKNIPLIFAALARLPENHTLRIAGGKGDPESARYVSELAAQFGVTGRVDYRGFVSPDRLVDEVISGSSALLLPLGDNLESKYFTSPMKLFEYMATPIPVVAVDYPSVTGICGRDSVFLSEPTPESFAEAVTKATGPTGDETASRIRKMNEIAGDHGYERRAARVDAWLKTLSGNPRR